MQASRRVKSLSILSSASCAIRPRYEIPNSVEPEAACASSRNDPTSSYLRAPSCRVRWVLRGRERVHRGCRCVKGGTGGTSATPIRTLPGLNDPRLIRHKRLILKNSGRDKSFRGGRFRNSRPSPLTFQAVSELLSGAD